jgi:hypothetical protein
LEGPIEFAQKNRDSLFLAYAYSTAGSAHGGLKDLEKALQYHQKALSIRQSPKFEAQKAESLYHVGRFLAKLGQYRASLDTLRAALKVMESGTNQQGLCHVQLGIADTLSNMGNTKDALPYLEMALKISMERKQYPPAQTAARMLCELHRKNRDFEAALQYKEVQLAIRDSMFNVERQKISQDLAAKYETREKELKISSLQREKELLSQRSFGLVGLLLLIFALLFYAFRMRTLHEKQRLVAERAQAAEQALQLAKELEITNVEMEANKNRLADYAQMLIERNNQISELSQQLELGLIAPNHPSNSEYDLFNQVILTESDWELFQKHFNSVYPNYIPELRFRLPDLTPAEMRLILLDKMGLSLKETATILGVSLDAVKKGRYRLKKKYNLEGDDLSRLETN